MSEKCKMYVTKYCLTKGILELEGEEVESVSGTKLFRPTGWCNRLFRDEYHFSRSGAASKANEMRIRKIASLRKQIAKLEAIKFQYPTT